MNETIHIGHVIQPISIGQDIGRVIQLLMSLLHDLK